MHIVLGSYRSFKRYMISDAIARRPNDPSYRWINDPFKVSSVDREVEEVIVLHDAEPQLIIAAEDRFGKDKLVFVE